MRVLVTARAKREIIRAESWWRENRPKAPDLFTQELEDAGRHLGTAPDLAPSYGVRKGRHIRRWLLPRTAFHVYFSVNSQTQTVTIHAVWSGRRRRGPRL